MNAPATDRVPPHMTDAKLLRSTVEDLEGSTGVDLRHYQREAIIRVVEEIAAGKRRVLLVAPTGSGKTVMFAHIAAAYHAMGLRVVVVTHRREIIAQSVTKLKAAGIADVGVYRGKKDSSNASAAVRVVAIQALIPGLIPADLVILDECHHCPSASWSALLEMYPDAEHIGATATPWWGDAKGLGDYFQTIVIAASVRDLIESGHLAKVRAFTHPHTLNDLDLRGVKTTAGDYSSSVSERVDKPKLIGDLVGHWQSHANGARALCFAASVEHSKHIVERFRTAGVTAEHVDGDTPEDERKGILARLHSGETRVVSNFNVLTEGFDAPDVGCIILARPTRRIGTYLQAVGRGLRVAEGKDSVVVLDHAGGCLMHGPPDADRVVSLKGLERSSSVSERGVTVRYCPRCGLTVKTGIKSCPECSLSLRSEIATEEPTGILVEAIADGERAVLLTLGSRTMTVAAWARELGISDLTIYTRIKRGASAEQALAPPRPISPMLMIELDGRTQNVSAWAREVGMSPNTIKRRIELGYTPKEAMTKDSKELTNEVRKAGRQQARVSRLEGIETKTIGQKIAQERSRRRWSQEDLARNARVSVNCISDAERGHRRPSDVIVAKLEDALNIDIAGRAQPTTLGDRIADERIRRGWTIVDLARRADLSNGVVRAIERGWTNPSIQTVTKLLDALGVEPPQESQEKCECGYAPAIGEVMYASVTCVANAVGRRWGTYLRATHIVDHKPCPHVMESLSGNMDAAIAADRFKGLRVMEIAPE